MNATADTGAVAGSSAQYSYGSIFERRILPLLRRKQPVCRTTPAEVDTKPFEKYWRQRNLTGNTAFSLPNKDDHALAVDVADFQVSKLVTPQSRRIERGDYGPVLQVRGVVENARDFFC